MTMFDIDAGQFDLVHNVLSFSLASMAASTMFLWLRMSSVHETYRSALVISSLVTFFAAYHYVRPTQARGNAAWSATVHVCICPPA